MVVAVKNEDLVMVDYNTPALGRQPFVSLKQTAVLLEHSAHWAKTKDWDHVFWPSLLLLNVGRRDEEDRVSR